MATLWLLEITRPLESFHFEPLCGREQESVVISQILSCHMSGREVDFVFFRDLLILMF